MTSRWLTPLLLTIIGLTLTLSLLATLPGKEVSSARGMDNHREEAQDGEAMLTSFAEWFYKADFDVVTGWNSAGYDMSVLYHRMESLRVPHCMNGVHFENGFMPMMFMAEVLCRLTESWMSHSTREVVSIYGNNNHYEVDHLDMMVAFKRLYKDSTNNELVSARLGRAAQFLGFAMARVA